MLLLPYITSNKTLASGFVSASLNSNHSLNLFNPPINGHTFRVACVVFDVQSSYASEQEVVGSRLLVRFHRHVLLNLTFLKLNSASHFVELHVEYLVGVFCIRLDNTQLLAVVTYFDHYVVKLFLKTFNLASQTVPFMILKFYRRGCCMELGQVLGRRLHFL